MNLKNYTQFLNESNNVHDLKAEIAGEIVNFHIKYGSKLYPTIKFRNKKGNDEYEIYDLLTANEFYKIHNDISDFEALVNIYDRYAQKPIEDIKQLEYILECLRKYEKFMDKNPKHDLVDSIAKALTGDFEMEKVFFNAIKLYRFKWDEFSDDLIDSLTDEEKTFLKSYTAGSKYKLFESKEDSNNWKEYIYKMKKMPAFSREKIAVGRGFWSWDPTWDDLDVSRSGIAINVFGPVRYYNNGANFTRIDDEKLINKIKGSIDFTYSYMFEQEEHNKLYQVVRSFIMNYDEDHKGEYDKAWVELFNHLVKKKHFKAIDEIYWKEDEFNGDMETIIRSTKGLSKFNI